MSEKHTLQLYLCAALATRPLWPPLSKEGRGGKERLPHEVTFRWRPQRGGRKGGYEGSSGGLYLWDHAAFRCEGWRTRGVKVSEVYSSAEPIFHNHYYFFLFLSLSLSSFLPVTLPLTFLPLAFKLFIAPPPTTTTITPPSCSLCNSLQRSVLRLFSWPGLTALLAISSGLYLLVKQQAKSETPQRVGGERQKRRREIPQIL